MTATRDSDFFDTLPDTIPVYPLSLDAVVTGEGIFENTSALIAVRYLEGLTKLEALTTEEVSTKRHSLLASLCSSPEEVDRLRQHLDSGHLHRVAAKMVANFFNPMSINDYTAIGYVCIILGACAMSLGCTTLHTAPGYKMWFPTYMAFLRGVCDSAPMMDVAKLQMRAALDGPQSFRSGVQIDFSVKDPKTSFANFTPAPITDKPQRTMGGLPNGYVSKVKNGEGKMVSMIGPCSKEDMGYSKADICGGCRKKNTKLMRCSRCKDQGYCSKTCQREDFGRHKCVCRKPEDAEVLEAYGQAFCNVFYIPM